MNDKRQQVMSNKWRCVLGLVLVLTLGACGNKKQFRVDGKIANGLNQKVYLERRGHADVTILDSLILGESGEFHFEQTALDYPEFYKIRVNDENINFMIDSTETVTIDTDLKSLDKDYKITGNEGSITIQKATANLEALYKKVQGFQELNKKEELSGQAFNDSVYSAFTNYKENAQKLILNNFRDPAAYYVVFLRYNGEQILNPYDKNDLSLFRTVATVWDNNYPNSPRNEFLKNYTLSAIIDLRKLQQQEKTMDQIAKMEPTSADDFFVINLPDINGVMHSTTDLKGKVVFLDFTAYDASNSAPRNILLNKVYERYKKDLEIYQVSFDVDNFKWKTVADNLPWITVRDPKLLDSPLITKFNIASLPTSYLLDKDGIIVKKIVNGDDLEWLIEEQLKK